MVLLAASICTRGGKPVISRQFREMPRSRVEALLASFPKLISAGSQHTTIETDSVRYVYQPLEDLYMILITNKSSNILQDIDTLHLFARTVSDMCRSLDEREVLRNSFELLGAFDEIVSLGYRENVGLTQIKTFLEMESHEEKIQEIIERNKEMEAKEELKRRAKQLEMQRREAARRGQSAFSGNSGGFGPGGGYQGVRQFEGAGAQAPVIRDTGSPAPSAPVAKPFKSKGMQLGKKSKNVALMGEEEDDLNGAAAATATAATVTAAASSAPAAARVSTKAADPVDLLPSVRQESVHLLVKERVTLAAARDGSLESLEVKGDLELRITDPTLSKLAIQVTPASTSSLVPSSSLQFKTHPHVDKAGWADGRQIRLRDSNKPFPVRQNLGVLRWRATTKDESSVPLSVQCWPSPVEDGSGACDVMIEFELQASQLDLQNVIITVPLPAGVEATFDAPDVGTAEAGDGILEWHLDEISQSSGVTSGQLEIRVNEGAQEVDVFFPVSVDFVSSQTLSEIAVASVVSAESSQAVNFSTQSVLSAENYHIN
ncbi:uncharacterized protein FA14DRAFT_172073 [Meira miltonrushii]|uniref:Coatomer subunit delta n=1 Tax=Meira miltonrushii TaxID=1280837 RepID=A0A316VGI1_9BASI|nr:uncharacterized protein FA14DRAFT_172073 [Meira miltonrushii]PWN35433.1 hypothetical protein FA14DRAFT_172073 [Meira miltonrushii]